MKARKMFWKPLAIIMIVCMFAQTVGAISLERESDKDIFVEGVDSKEKVQLIINAINGEEIISSRANILCVLGHSTARGTAKEINHRQYATAPRCVQNLYDVTYCTRSGCNYIIYTLTGSSRIHCCT